MSASSELGLVASLVIMVVALLAQRNRKRPLRGRAAQITYGIVLTIGAVGAVGALVIIVLLAANR
jgi:uncharacterized membrane protein YgdD (TMEM256/DUF423 family)